MNEPKDRDVNFRILVQKIGTISGIGTYSVYKDSVVDKVIINISIRCTVLQREEKSTLHINPTKRSYACSLLCSILCIIKLW